MSLALAEFGADTLLVDRNESGARTTAETIEGMGRGAVTLRCVVSDPVQIRELFQCLDAEFGRIDFLGNVAGEGVLGAPEEISLEEVDRCWRNLVLGRFYMCQEASRIPISRRRCVTENAIMA